ncbi:MAG TPA: hypothetical protein DC047_10090 [Blastocatellia bacterium]|nr:hypothetical protein [Blastocatellia bacterium]
MSPSAFGNLDRIQASAANLRRRLKLPDHALLCIYFLVFARQYFWWISANNGIAWVGSVLVAVVLSLLYISYEEAPEENKPGLPFWLIVFIPLLLIYALRVALPDVSFDVLNYHLFHGERALRGFLYLPGEFFPTPSPFSPAPDMVTGLFRKLLGYRLGTFANFLAVVWVARVADRLLRPFLPNVWLRASGVLLALLAEHLLGEINNYMPDLLAVPLLLEATYLVLRHDDYKNARANFVRIALLLGMSIAFKLTNAAFALPIVLLCAYHALAGPGPGRLRQAAKRIDVTALAFTTLLCALAFFAALLPFSVYLYRETGSPIFPVYNGIFKSVYWPASNVWDPRWGPFGLLEKLLWPILISFKPARLSELPIYSGRISSGFVAALIGVFFSRHDVRLRKLCFIVLAASLLWSVSTGYIRYALYLEVMAPIVLLALASKLFQTTARRFRPLALGTALLLCIALVVHAYLGFSYLLKWELSQRPTFLSQPGVHRDEARYLLRDHSLRDFLSPELESSLARVDVWIISSIKTSGLAVLLKPDSPMIGVNTYEFFDNQISRDRFNRALENAAGKRMFSLALVEDIEGAKVNLTRRGLEIVKVEPMQIPFYSYRGTIAAFLIETKRTAPDSSRAGTDLSPKKENQLSSAYRAQITSTRQPVVMEPGAKEVLHFKVRNLGANVWSSHSPQGWIGVMTIGDRWLTADGSGVVNEMDSRTVLSHDVKPGEETEIELTVTAPNVPGEYLLEIDMVHEGVTWFYQQGSRTLRWQVKVEK